ncbi:MAG: AAA family ATPase, partial [Bdellovibrionales bacterium]|nr:AAA family ATPase [Bdellovibrionales bacterium]
MFKRWISLSEENQLVIGSRRSGKTTFLKQRFPNLKYTTLDDLDLLQWARGDGKGFIESLNPSAIIDEIQRVPELTV